MLNIVNNSFNLSTFLKNIKLNINYFNNLQSRILEFNSAYEYDFANAIKTFQNVAYIVYIIQNRTDLVMHIANSQGDLIYSVNSYSMGFSGRAKQKAQKSITKKFIQVLIHSRQFSFLKNKPIALHLTGIGSIKQWVIKELKDFFFIELIRIFTAVSFNGCRKKKLRRKKIRKKKNKKKSNEGVAEWFKAADCKSAEETYRRFKSCPLQNRPTKNFSKYNAVGSVSALGAESHVFKSHYFEKIQLFYFI